MFIIIKQFLIFSIFWSNIKLDKLDFNARVFVFRNDCVTRVNRWFVSRVRDLCTWNTSKYFQLFLVQSPFFLKKKYIYFFKYIFRKLLIEKTLKISKFKMFQVNKFLESIFQWYKQNLMFKIHGKKKQFCWSI